MEFYCYADIIEQEHAHLDWYLSSAKIETNGSVTPAASSIRYGWKDMQLIGPTFWGMKLGEFCMLPNRSPSKLNILMSCLADPLATIGACRWTAKDVNEPLWASNEVYVSLLYLISKTWTSPATDALTSWSNTNQQYLSNLEWMCNGCYWTLDS